MTMNIERENIDRLVKEAFATIPQQEIYNMALRYCDIEALQAAKDLTAEEIAMTFSLCGFHAGLIFALENIDIQDDSAESDTERK